jgi:hypothetical protein
MRNKNLVSLMMLLAVILFWQPPINAKTGLTTLKEQFKAGQSFTAIEKMDMEVQIEAAGNDFKLKLASGIGYRYTVKQVSKEGAMTIGLAIYSLYNDLPDVMGVSTSFDSTDPFAVPHPSNLMTNCLVGQEIEAELRPDATVSDVKFSDAFLDWILECSKKQKKSLTKEQFKGLVLQAVGDRIAKAEASLEQGVFTEKPVKVGDSWEKTVKMDNAGFGLIFRTTYTLKQRLKGLALVEVNAKILGVGTESGQDSYDFLNLSGWLQGTIAVNEANGWMHDFDLKFAIDGEVQLKTSAKGDDANNKTAPKNAAEAIDAGNPGAAGTKEELAQAQDGKTEAETAETGKFCVSATIIRRPLE